MVEEGLVGGCLDMGDGGDCRWSVGKGARAGKVEAVVGRCCRRCSKKIKKYNTAALLESRGSIN